jgi:Uma2 family endonuclease
MMSGAMIPRDISGDVIGAIRPLRRAEFERLAVLGYFDDERVELLGGALVEMTPPDPSHDHAVNRLARLLVVQLGDAAEVRVQSAFAASEDSEPLPDVVVAPRGDYWHEHPASAMLVVEVARSSLGKDRGPKAILYATAAVEEYWIVNIVDGVVEVYREPLGDGRWGRVTLHRRGERIAPVAFPSVTIAVDDIVPPG